MVPLRLAGGMNERSAAFDAQHVLELPREYRVSVNTDAFRNASAYAGGRVTYVRRIAGM
jgi:hypothetical protein